MNYFFISLIAMDFIFIFQDYISGFRKYYVFFSIGKLKIYIIYQIDPNQEKNILEFSVELYPGTRVENLQIKITCSCDNFFSSEYFSNNKKINYLKVYPIRATIIFN